jgi:predicted RNase H-related nuclease YkuK (DUF458 family)
MQWKHFNGEFLSNDLHTEVEDVLTCEKNAGNTLRVCIGSDSQVKGKIIEFATAIVFVREKRGGFMFIATERIRNKLSIKERMLAEVNKSIETTYQLTSIFNRFGIQPEVHADINTSHKFKSSTAFAEAMGYIISMGYCFKAKPDAFASSYCANRAVQ